MLLRERPYDRLGFLIIPLCSNVEWAVPNLVQSAVVDVSLSLLRKGTTRGKRKETFHFGWESQKDLL